MNVTVVNGRGGRRDGSGAGFASVLFSTFYFTVEQLTSSGQHRQSKTQSNDIEDSLRELSCTALNIQTQ